MPGTPDGHRVISRDLEDGRRVIAVTKTGGASDEKTDDEIIDAMLKWADGRRHLRAVDDE